MFKNYLKIAWRNLRKHKAYSTINIAGLALGMAGCILMMLYVQNELAFDSFHAKADRIYRIVETQTAPEQGERNFPFAMGPVGPALVAEIPEVIQAVRLRDRSGSGRFSARYGERHFYEGDHLIAEPSFFDIFDFKLLQGDAQTALREPLAVVLTQSAAQKYFGNEEPLGKILSTDRYGDLHVTGVMADPPRHSHLDFSMLISFATLEASRGWKQFIASWDSDSFITYVLTQQPVEIAAFNAKLEALRRKHQNANSPDARRLAIQPLLDIHFHSAHLEFDRNSGKSNVSYLYVFSAIAFFILFIACINYMNLAAARALKRAKEIGMRKVAGAFKGQLISQFLGESVLFSFLSLLLAVVLVELLLPSFNGFFGKDLALSLGGKGLMLLILVLLAFFVGIVSGSYPAFYLAKLSPVILFKGEYYSHGGATQLRRGLVVAQFSLSIIMIIATVVAARQLNFIRTKNLGFKHEQLVMIDINSGIARRNFASLKNEMANIPGVTAVSVTSRVPGEWKNLIQIEATPSGGVGEGERTLYFMGVDEDFLQTFEVDLIKGRNFSKAMSTDSSAILINETAARLLDWDSPLQAELTVPARKFRGRVIGVVKDFHFQSLHEEIGPLVLGHWDNRIQTIDYFTVRIRPEKVSQTLAALQEVHEHFDQTTPFEYNFLDDRLNDFYQADIRTGKIFGISAGLAIFIACLGLLGLTAFTTEQRTKEIGVRKVLGASVVQIVMLLSKDFTLLVVLAAAIASPIAYWALVRWLRNFAYHVTLGVDTFLLAGLVALLVAWLTISVQAVRAALANPVEALRYE